MHGGDAHSYYTGEGKIIIVQKAVRPGRDVYKGQILTDLG